MKEKVVKWAKKNKKKILLVIGAIAVTGGIIWIAKEYGNNKKLIITQRNNSKNKTPETIRSNIETIKKEEVFTTQNKVKRIPRNNIRLTKSNREKILKMNEGFSTSTSYESRNSSEYRTYKIENGQVIIEASGKTSWADSRYSKKYIADDEQTHRFIYNNLGCLNTDI